MTTNFDKPVGTEIAELAGNIANLTGNIADIAFTPVTSGTSFDTLSDGISYGTGMTNAPATGYFFVLTLTSDREKVQLAFQRSATPSVYFRERIGTNWNAWHQFTIS